jgi:hypothetical protein
MLNQENIIHIIKKVRDTIASLGNPEHDAHECYP